MLSEDQVLDEFRAAGALLEGHFILSSGLHSPAYLQCARVLMDASRADRLCKSLYDKISAEIDISDLDLIASPAMGGVVVGYEMGRQFAKPSLFFERVEGALLLRRGFAINKGQRVIMIEDIVTTGLSSRECITAITELGGEVIAAGCLIDRSGGKADVGVPLISLARLDIPTYQADDVPADLASLEAVKPGSRGLRASV